MTRKRRVPISPDLSAEVRHASDNTCCVCRKSGKPVQLHHIDENPAHNVASNLAVLCLECHDTTQVHGGFGRKLDAALVTRYRDEWLAMVQVKRSQALPPTPDTRSDNADQPQSAAEQARLRAAYLRGLYAEFIAGISQMYSVAEAAQEAIERGEDVAALLQSQDPTLGQAARRLSNTAHQIRVEPGAERVCAAYDKYQAISRQHMHYILTYVRAPSAMTRLTIALALEQYTKRPLQVARQEMEAAARQHIASVDRLTQVG